MTRPPLELLAEWLEAERDEPAATRLLGSPMTARLEDARAAVFSLDPASLRAQAEAGKDTTDYDNAVTETVCDRLLDAIAGQGEPSFGGPRLNMIVRLIRDLRAQADAQDGPQ